MPRIRTSRLLAILATVAIHSGAFAQATADAFVAKIPGANITSQVTISASSAFAAPGQSVQISFTLAIAGTTPPTVFQIDLIFNPAALTFTAAQAGAQLTAAQEGISSTLVSPGDLRLATTGANQKPISNGVVANVSFTVSPLFRDLSTPVTPVNCLASSVAGTPLSTGCIAGSVSTFTCDLQGNENIGVADVQSVINQALGLAPPVNDLNHDGRVTVTDIQKEIDAALGLGCPY